MSLQIPVPTSPEMAHRAAFAPHNGEHTEHPDKASRRLPDETVSPAHVKAASTFGSMLHGTMTHLAADAGPFGAVALSKGAFQPGPAGLADARRGISDSARVTIRYQDGAFDVLPVAQ